MKSFKQCMVDALRPVMYKHLGQPVQSIRLRLSTRTDFGDAQLRPQKAFGKMFIRMALVFPIGCVGVALCASIVGLPLGLPIMWWIGSWCSKPLRKHPSFNTDVGHNTRGGSAPTVESYERVYDEYEYGYDNRGREWK